MKKVIVCGAGIGGLVTAIRLAEKGFDVEIYEKNTYAGGKMGELRKDGFRFDTGPSVITMPVIFEEFFKDIKRNMDNYFEFVKPDVSCRYFWNDGTVFNQYCDEDKLYDELVKVFSAADEAGFIKFMDYGKNFFEIYNDVFGNKEFNIRNYLSKKYLANFTKFISGKSINDVSNKFFRDKKLKQIINRYATFSGSSPYLCPQFFTLIPYVEFKYGTWHVKGGMYKIASALENICIEYGIKINYGKKLKTAESKDRKLSKLIFEKNNGVSEEVTGFDFAVSDFTNNKSLLGQDYFENTDWSGSGFMIYIAMNKTFPELLQHNVFFSDDYENEYIDVYEKKIPADDMTIYISVSGKSDVSDCPAGTENGFVFVNAPHLSDKFIWNEKSRKEYFDKVIGRLECFNFLFDESPGNYIRFYEVFTPEDFKTKFNCEYGSIYGLSSNSLYTLIKRPKNKSDKFGNLYFTGGNTNPGGGVPLCFLSGKMVSEMIN